MLKTKPPSIDQAVLDFIHSINFSLEHYRKRNPFSFRINKTDTFVCVCLIILCITVCYLQNQYLLFQNDQRKQYILRYLQLEFHQYALVHKQMQYHTVLLPFYH